MALRRHREGRRLTARTVARHLETSEDTIERIERSGQALPSQVRRLCSVYGIAPYGIAPEQVGAELPAEIEADGSGLLALSRIASGERMLSLFTAARNDDDHVLVAWHLLVVDRGRSTPEAQKAVEALERLVTGWVSRRPRGLVGQINFEREAAEQIAGLRRHRLFLYGAPFAIVQEHIDTEISPMVYECVALAVADDNTASVLVTQKSGPLVDSHRHYFDRVVPVAGW